MTVTHTFVDGELVYRPEGVSAMGLRPQLLHPGSRRAGHFSRRPAVIIKNTTPYYGIGRWS